jgi:5,5'-dehydrodivanillate O-demethylase oxygenase subunit
MLSHVENEQLTEVGAGTPMGELLRRYWMPIAAVTEFNDKAIKPLRLMGEELVLYKDLSGTYGLVDRQCPHRRADLSYGFVEQCGLRCNYHGWLYDEAGNCREQPYDDIANPKGRFKDKIKIKSYPVQAHAGLLWAYLGPAPAPLIPNWEPFTWKNGFAQIVFAEIPCNWFQCQENSIDPVHFEWMHTNWAVRLKGGDEQDYGPRHVKVDFDEHDFGFVYRRVREDTDTDHAMWTVGRVCLWPNAFFLGDHIEWRVPVDDGTTLSVTWAFNRVPPNREPYVQDEIPYWYGPIMDPDGERWISSHVMNQDFIAWVGQGRIADRTRENLSPSDKGVAMIRRRFKQDLDKIAKGEDPKAVFRESADNAVRMLPVAERKMLVDGLSLEDLAKHPVMGKHLKGYVFQAGQSAHVWDAFVAAMGIVAD